MADSQPRSYEDFKDDLTAAEKQVLDELDSGEPIELGDGNVPSANPGDDQLVRARFLRWVILGCEGSSEHRVHEKGVQIAGALVIGEGAKYNEHAALDLEGTQVACDVFLSNCWFVAKPKMIGGQMRGVFLNGSKFPGLEADGLTTQGDLSLRDVLSDREVSLVGARIQGDLVCDNAELRNSDKDGNVVGPALTADGAHIRGYLFLKEIKAFGEIGLRGAHVDRNLECDGAEFSNQDKSGLPNGTALTAKGAQIEGGFLWKSGEPPIGKVDLIGASIGVIDDNGECWPAKGQLLLNRCQYGAFTGEDVNAQARLDWLDRVEQPEKGFEPQPYEQCAKVLREMGHQGDAKDVLIEKEKLQRRAKRATLSGPSLWWHGFWDGFLASTVRYGQKPLCALFWLAGLWLAGTIAFYAAWKTESFKPNNAFVLRAPEWVLCATEGPRGVYLPSRQNIARGRAAPGQSQLACFRDQPEAQQFPEFNAGIYTLDVLFPLVQVEQQSHWVPDEDRRPWGLFAKGLVYIEIIAGWLLSLLAVAGLSGIIKSD